MSKPSLFKRRLLRAAVQENVDVIRDSRPRLLPRSRLPRPVWLNRGLVAGVAVALLPLVYAVATVSENRLPDVAQSYTESSPGESAQTLDAAAIFPFPIALPLSSAITEGFIDPETLMSAPHPIDLSAFALPVRTIVIDPGHGGNDPGAVTAQGLTEKEIALDIGLRLRQLLVASSFAVRMTREADSTVSLRRRVGFANQERGDLFVSIHVNWVEPRRTRVVETYYLGPTDDAASLQLAKVENQHSGHSLADFRSLLEQVYSNVKRGESRKLAEHVQLALVDAVQEKNPALKNQAVKTAPFVVLVGANMPAILAEVGCLSNKEDAQLLAFSDYRQHIAQALFSGVRAYATTLYHANALRKDVSS